MRKKLLSLLVCPICKGELEYQRKSAELICRRDKLAYPVRNGIPILLEMDARQLEPTDEQRTSPITGGSRHD